LSAQQYQELGDIRRNPPRQLLKSAMTRFGRSSLEAAIAVVAIMLGTVIVHLILSWWPALAALI
jgi:hypothetical protein